MAINQEIGMIDKVMDEEVPYHSRVYYFYVPVKGFNYEKRAVIYYKDENDDTSEDKNTKDNNDGRNECYDEKSPLAQIKRAHTIDNDIHEDMFPGIFDHDAHTSCIGLMEEKIFKKGWSVKDLKIFHIWNISLNKKQHSLPSLIKFQSKTKKIEFELDSLVKSEIGTSGTKTKVNFSLDTKDCDRILSAKVDDCEVNYSLFSNAFRVNIEIRAYNADGSSALNVSGKVSAYLSEGHTKYRTLLFDTKNKHGKSEPVAASDTPLVSSVIILPGRGSGTYHFAVDISLNDSTGKFVVKRAAAMLPVSIAVDSQHYILGKPGYIILRAFWACLCMEQGLCKVQDTICTCACGTALGTALGAFKVQHDDVSDDEYEEDETTCNADSVEGRKKKAKISQSPTSICSSATAIGAFQTESKDGGEGPENIKIATSMVMFGEEIKNATLENNNVLIVLCFVAKWSNKCKYMENVINELATREKKVVFIMADIDDMKRLAWEWRVAMVPTYILLKRELIVETVTGVNKEGLFDCVSKWKGKKVFQPFPGRPISEVKPDDIVKFRDY